MHRILVSLGLLVTNTAFAQAPFEFRPTQQVVVIENDDTLANPWAGGLNTPVFSNLDLNLDGTQDLIAFERETRRLVPFVFQPDAPHPWRYAPEYIERFPLSQARDFIYIRDYNQDGLGDLFCGTFGTGGAAGRIGVYRNSSPPGGPLTFTLETLELQTDYNPDADPLNAPTNPGSILFTFDQDIPGIADVDNDGDIDLVTGLFSGGTFAYDRNLSVENDGTPGLGPFERRSTCWGHFLEDYFVGPPPVFNLQPSSPCTGEFKTQHFGGGIYLLHLNGDTLMDAIISDIGVDELVGFFNGGTRAVASYGNQELNFPTSSTELQLTTYPNPGYVQLTTTGPPQLLVAPGDVRGFFADNTRSVWRYRNVGTASDPEFTLVERDFLQNGMLDAGTFGGVLFAELTGDDRPDMLLYSNLERVIDSANITNQSRLQLYANTGTAQAPVFELQDTNFLGTFASFGQFNENFRPAVGDLDNDGDKDILLVNSVAFETQIYHFYENTSGPGNAPVFSRQTKNFANLGALGLNFPSVEVFDYNADGFDDLLIGSVGGQLRLFLNDACSPAGFEEVTDAFGGISVDQPTTASQEVTVPHVADLDNDGANELLVSYGQYGSGPAGLVVYDGLLTNPSLGADSLGHVLDAALAPEHQMVLPAVYPVRRGDTSLVAVGVKAGGLLLFEVWPSSAAVLDSTGGFSGPLYERSDSGCVPTSRTTQQEVWTLSLYPNPSHSSAILLSAQAATGQIVNSLGQVVSTFVLQAQQPKQLDASELPMGIYHVVVATSSQQKVLQWSILR